MKTFLAVLVLSSLTALPAAASETTFALRGLEKPAAAPAEAKAEGAPAPAEAAPAKKVRIVLASPYGN